MSITTYTSKIKKSAIKYFERECSNCGHKWHHERQVSVEGEGWAMDPLNAAHSAQEDAQKKLKSKLGDEKDNINVDVLCSVCGHFDKKATEKNFKKGYKDFLLSRYKRQKLTIRRTCISCGIIAVLLLGYVIYRLINAYFTPDYTKGDVSWFFLSLCTVVSIIFAIVFFERLKKYNSCKQSLLQVINKIINYSEERALQLVAQCYHKGDNSLVRSDVWVNVLMEESR